MGRGTYLYIPVEIYRRELNGMMILSLVAARAGWTVVLGGKRAIFPYLNKMPEGVVLAKSIVHGEIENQKRMRAEGFQIISLDAEGLVLSSGEIGAALRYSNETIALSDRLFFWGRRQFEIVKHYFPNVAEISEISGSPIFDFWKYRKFLSDKKPKHNRRTRVLIATSFAYPNHVVSEAMAEKLLLDTIQANVSKDKVLADFYNDAKLQSLIFPKFKEFVRELIDRCPDVDFILRPHVAENPEPWIEIGSQYKNVQMNLVGEISSVLVDSDVLIHFNSTTSIEASYFGKAVITYLPSGLLSENLRSKLNSDTLKASTVCETVDRAAGIIKAERIQRPAHIDFEEIIEGWNSKVLYSSSAKIVEALNKFEVVKPVRRLPSRWALALNKRLIEQRLKSRILWALGWLDHYTGLFKNHYALSRNYYSYGKTKQGSEDINYAELFNLAESMIKDFNFSDSDIRLRVLKRGMILIKSERS